MAEQEAGSDAGADANVMRIGKRVFVSNLAWKSSWQDLKVGCCCSLACMQHDCDQLFEVESRADLPAYLFVGPLPGGWRSPVGHLGVTMGELSSQAPHPPSVPAFCH